MKDEKSTKRIKTAGYDHSKADARKGKRRAEAEFRQTVYDGLPVADRLALLDKAGHEARRERAKLYPRLFNVEIVPNKKKAAVVA